MPPKIPPPFGLALTILRSAQGWSQKRLAAASGVSKTMLSDFEVGRRTLSRARLESLASVLGLGPEAVDAALLCLERVRPTGDASQGASAAERRTIEETAALVARTALDVTRSELARQLDAARTREARRGAEELWDRLKRHPARERRVLIEGALEFQTWALCERLCAESEKAAAADVNRALELADLALRVAVLVPGEAGWHSRLQSYAWAHVGNARRVSGNLPGSDEAFARSDALWKAGCEGTGPLDEARLLDLKASLRKHQGKFDEALVLHERALRLAKPADSGYIVLNMAITLEQMGKYESAITTLAQAAPLVRGSGQRGRRLRLALQFNLAVNLCHLGRYSEAETRLREVRELAVDLGNELDLVRILWLEGRIAAGLARTDQAIAALAQVRTEFGARGITYDAALATLELAVLHLEQRRTDEVKALARQMTPVFQAQGVHREALAALRLFCEAAERQAATADLARRLVEYLQRARHDSRLRFEI